MEIKVRNQGLKHPVVASRRLSNPGLEIGFEIAKLHGRRIAKKDPILGEPVEQTTVNLSGLVVCLNTSY